MRNLFRRRPDSSPPAATPTPAPTSMTVDITGPRDPSLWPSTSEPDEADLRFDITVRHLLHQEGYLIDYERLGSRTQLLWETGPPAGLTMARLRMEMLTMRRAGDLPGHRGGVSGGDRNRGIRIRILQAPVPLEQPAVVVRTPGLAMIRVNPRYTHLDEVLRVLRNLATATCAAHPPGTLAPRRVEITLDPSLTFEQPLGRLTTTTDEVLLRLAPGLSIPAALQAVASAWETAANHAYPELTGWGAGTSPPMSHRSTWLTRLFPHRPAHP